MPVKKTLLMAAAALSLAFATPAFADATVKVDLWDKGGMMDLSKSMGMGMGMGADMMKAIMGVKLDKTEVPAGKVTFEVVNSSKETEHELIIAPIADANAVLPFKTAENQVDEDAAGYLGEVEDVEPGKSGSITLDLKPGLYLLFCNVPGHYMAGMWTVMEVK